MQKQRPGRTKHRRERPEVLFRRYAVGGCPKDMLHQGRQSGAIIKFHRFRAVAQRDRPRQRDEPQDVRKQRRLAFLETARLQHLAGVMRTVPAQDPEEGARGVFEGDPEAEDPKTQDRGRHEPSGFVSGEKGDSFQNPFGFRQKSAGRRDPLFFRARPPNAGLFVESLVGPVAGVPKDAIEVGEVVRFRAIAREDSGHRNCGSGPLQAEFVPVVRGCGVLVQQGQNDPSLRRDGHRRSRDRRGQFSSRFEVVKTARLFLHGGENAQENQSDDEALDRDKHEQKRRDP